MTVASTARRNDYTGSGITGPYPFGFRIYAATDLAVVTIDASGTESSLSYPAGFTVDGVGVSSGGAITLTTALPVGSSLRIERNLPLLQPRSIRNQGSYFPATIEDALDYLTMVDQQQQDNFARAVRIPASVSAGTTDISAFSPLKYLRVNAGGTGIEGVDVVVAAQNFLQSGTGAVVRSANAKMAEVFSVMDFGALGNGVADDTAAIQRCIDAACDATIPNAIVVFPWGQYLVTSQITIAHDRTHLVGAGLYGSVIRFNPTGSGEQICFKFVRDNSAGVSPLYQCSLQQMSFVTDNTTKKKVAIDLYDASSFTLSHVSVLTWNGLKSTGLRTNGHDLSRFEKLSIYADRPIRIQSSPAYPTLACDHFHFEDCELVAHDPVEAVIWIDNNVSVTNLKFEGNQAWGGGKYGLYYAPAAVPSTSVTAVIRNLRFEEPFDNTGYAVYWTAATVGLVLDACNLGGIGSPTNGGLYVRNVSNVTLRDCQYTGAGVAIDCDGATVNDLHISNAALFVGAGSQNITNMTRVIGVRSHLASAPDGAFAWYTANGAAGAKSLFIHDVAEDRMSGILAAGAYLNIPFKDMSYTNAIIELTAYSATGPVEAYGRWRLTPSSVKTMDAGEHAATDLSGGNISLFRGSATDLRFYNGFGVDVKYVARLTWTYTPDPPP